ncbi:MAG: HEAT repeat domain-containing protein [Candidatus Omnitrophica bacterium]|nr:HEAT repeat domain-containing protein [Candidatus Omnitrophota bacterium]
MSEILKKISKLVESEDPELAGASLKVVGALKLKNNQIFKGIKKHIENENPRLKQAAIDTLGRIGSQESVAYLFPIYKNDANLRSQVGHALAQIGDPVLPALEKEYEKAGNQREYRKSLLSVIARVKSHGALKFLLGALFDEDLEILKHVCYEMRNVIEKIDLKEKASIQLAVAEGIRRAQTKKLNNTLVSLIIIVGYLADKKSKKTLLHFLDKKFPFVLRRNALISLGRIGLQGKGNEDMVDVLVALFEDNDFAGFHRSIIEILEKQEFSKPVLKQIVRHAESKSPEIRRFALSKMSHVDTKENVQLLVNNLFHQDYQVRQSSEEALKKMASSVPTLLKVLAKEESPDRLNRIGNILSFHRGEVSQLRLKEIFASMEKAIEKFEDVKAQAYFNMLKQINPDFTHHAILKEAAALKTKKKYKEEVKLLELLSSSTVFTKEAKWELMVANLKLSSKDLSSVARNNDRALAMVMGFIKAQDKDLIKRLFKEKVLTPQELYYLGFHFSEKLFDQKQFGVDLLKTMIKKSPRNQFSIQAKKRLQVVGTATQTLEQS